MKTIWKNMLWASVSLALLLAIAILFAAPSAWAQHLLQGVNNAASDTTFTYQGRLTHNGAPVTGSCTAHFSLYDAQNGGLQIGPTQTSTITPHDGLFTTALDFGASPFNGAPRWLDIAVKCAGDGDWVTLGRTPITAAPYALYALKAAKTEGYGNVIVVAKSGGDYATIQAAIDALPNSEETLCKTPMLVWVAPGAYTETVTLKPCMTLEGAGKDLTIIKSGGGFMATQATVMVGTQTTIRSLTILNQGEASYATGVYAVGVPNHGYPPVILEDVKINVSNVLTGSIAAIGVNVQNNAITLNNVEIDVFSNDADAIGVNTNDSSVSGRDVSIQVNSMSGKATGLHAPTFSVMTLFDSSLVAQSWQDDSKATAVAAVDASLYATHVNVLSSGVGLDAACQSGGGGYRFEDAAISSGGNAIYAHGNDMVQVEILESSLSSNSGQSLLLDGGQVYAKMRLTELNGGAASITVQNGAHLACLQAHNQNLQPVTCP